LVRATAPAGDCAWSGHAVHAALPDAFLYVPAAHAEHVAPSAPENPGLHRQSVWCVEALRAVLASAGQAVHASGPLAFL
jgi:hypothetical protein